MTEKQKEMLYDYFNEGQGGDCRYVANLDKNYFLINNSSEDNDFMEFLEGIGATWEDFKKEYEVEDIDYWENYFICDECGEVIYMNEYGVNQGYVKTYKHNLICNDCADWKDIIEDFINKVDSCINTDYDLDNELIECGFHKHDSYDFNMCELITPEKIIERFEKDYDYVWVLTHQEMFGVSAELWLKEKL